MAENNIQSTWKVDKVVVSGKLSGQVHHVI